MPPAQYPQAKYWILTIPHHAYTPYLHSSCNFITGQLERGEGGFLHWQIVVGFKKPTRLTGVRNVFGRFHAETTRSEHAEQYVHKLDTRVDGTEFTLGAK